MKKQMKVKAAAATGGKKTTEMPKKATKPQPKAMAAFGQDGSDATPPDIIVEN